MFKRTLLCILVMVIAVFVSAGFSSIALADMVKNDYTRQWVPLCNEQKYEEARKLCEGWLKEKGGNVKKAEAHKCLANVEISQANRMVRLEADDGGGGALLPGYEPATVDLALMHLGKAIAFAPNDLSIYQGRLHILIQTGRYFDTPKALADTLKSYRGPDAIEEWIVYSYEMFNMKQFRASIEYLKELEKKYPENHKVAANMGGMLFMMEEDDEGIRYARKAVSLKPGDPINNWNLGRMYDYKDDIKQADKYYSKALELYGKPKDFDPRRTDVGGGLETVISNYCLYSEFVEKKLKNRKRACKLRKESCPEAYEALCTDKK